MGSREQSSRSRDAISPLNDPRRDAIVANKI
jgi:hypothetical protein